MRCGNTKTETLRHSTHYINCGADYLYVCIWKVLSSEEESRDVLQETYIDMQRLAPYTTDGYEWRFMHYTTSGIYNGLGKWWPWSYWSYNVDNSKDWQSTGDGTEYNRKFTVTQDGVDYTECKVADINYDEQGRIKEIVELGDEKNSLQYNESGLLISMDSAHRKKDPCVPDELL